MCHVRPLSGLWQWCPYQMWMCVVDVGMLSECVYVCVCIMGLDFLTPAAPGKAGRGMPGKPSLLWIAVAETICAEDMDAMLWRALSFTV